MPINNPKGGTQWTADHVADLAEKVAKGTTYRHIAAELNDKYGTTYTKNSIVGKVCRLGLTPVNKPGAYFDSPRPPRPKKRSPRPRLKREVIRIIPANSNSNAMHVVKTVVADGQPDLRCADVEPRHVPLPDLTGCKYPYGDGPFTFCNHPRMDGSSYCAPHHFLCWVPPRVLTDKRFVRVA